MKLMKSLDGHTSVHHEGKLYTPNKKGEFEVDDGHVESVKAHGLMLIDEANSAAKAKLDAAERSKLQAENEELKRKLADNELAKENEQLKAKLAELEKDKK